MPVNSNVELAAQKRIPVNELRERWIERAACEWAEAAGWYVRKFNSTNHRGVPDRIFIRDGRVVFIEFKGPKGKLTALQDREIKLLRRKGVEAYVCRTVEGVVAKLSTGDA